MSWLRETCPASGISASLAVDFGDEPLNLSATHGWCRRCLFGTAMQFGLLLAGLLGVVAIQPARAANDPHVLVLGRISDNPQDHYEQLKPLLDYVVPRMRSVGITEGRILMARDSRQMASYLRRGRVDWVTETTGTALQLERQADAEPLLLTERDGVSSYHTVFFSRRNSNVDSLGDLTGHSIALQHVSSTSAYFIPAAEMLDDGLRMEILLSPMEQPSSNAVGYVFARSELNISTWVAKGLVDAGAMSNLDWDNPKAMPPNYRKDMKIFHESISYPRALEMVRSDLEPAVAARLREVLLEAATDPDAGDALLQFFKTTRFLPIDGELEQTLDVLRKRTARVSTELE